MDDETRKSAIEKLKYMRSIVGHIDEVTDDSILEEYYQNLDITSDYNENYVNLLHFNQRESLENLRKLVDKTDLTHHAGSITAVNTF